MNVAGPFLRIFVALAKFATLAMGHIKFVQGKLAQITVKGWFGDETSRLFDQLSNNPGLLTDEVVETARTSAILASVRDQFTSHRGSQRGGRRGRGRGQQTSDWFNRATSQQFNRQRNQPNETE